MDGISSTSGAPAAAQFVSQQIKLQQAKRTAEQAEQAAQTLRAQARSAQRTADHAQDNARSLAVQSDQADANAGQARQGLSTLKAVSQISSEVTRVVDQAAANRPDVQATAPTPEAPAAVVNTQGQVTGTVINVTA